jgi:FlaA1/EpsC-like NDP-sugar epimerase
MTSKQNDTIEVLIIGAGKAGELIASNITSHKDGGFRIIGFIDDDASKQSQEVAGYKVLGTVDDIARLVKEHGIEELIIALPSERGRAIRTIVEKTSGLKLGYKILPRQSEVLIQGFDQDFTKYIREVRAEDLLGGEILKSDQAEISDFAGDQTVMITGAAGSIGSELSRQIIAHSAKKVVLFDWWENGIFELGNQIKEDYPDANVSYVIGDVKDVHKINAILELYKPTTIFHAAAYKHVPLMEANPAEAVKNNIFGTKNVAEAAIKHGVKKFILVSTDKAVNPTNIMGATKRAAEKVIHILSQGQSTTVFCAVRFGNVINSNGSAIPFFEKQIQKGGPVTVTHKDVTRFFMTIPEAVHLILQTWVMGENNDLFVLDMGESIKIYDLARLLITLHGYVPDEEIKIKIIGLRPGEKLYEEVLVQEEETQATSVKKVFRTQNFMSFDKERFVNKLEDLQRKLTVEYSEPLPIKEDMLVLISTYKPADN